MDGMEAVLEAPETVEIESSEGVSSPEFSGETQDKQQTPESKAAADDKAYRAWLKEQRDADPEKNGKYARLSKDNAERLREVSRIEQRGIDGIRETYAALDSVVHGELKGIAAVGAIQDDLRAVQETDALLEAGDPKALDILGEGFNEGLAKLTPTILDRVRSSNPEAYAAAVLPHFVEALEGSDLVRTHNAIVDALLEKPADYLTEPQKQAWQTQQLKKLAGLVAANSNWLNAQQAKAKEIPKPGAAQPKPGQAKLTPEQERLQGYEKQEEEQHWKQNITPGLDKHADAKFDEAFRPYAKRLHLDKAATSDLKQSFVQGVTKKATSNPAYTQQMGRYHSQKKADPNTVLNFAKVEFDKHAKTVMEGLVKQRYNSFLNGRPQPIPKPTNGAKPAPPSPGVQIVTVKPTNIDFKNTPLDWLHVKKYRTTDGKVVQVRR